MFLSAHRVPLQAKVKVGRVAIDKKSPTITTYFGGKLHGTSMCIGDMGNWRIPFKVGKIYRE